MCFTFLSRKWLSRKSQSWGGLCRQNAAHTHPEEPGSGLLHDPAGFYGILSFTPLILGRLLQVLDEGVATMLTLHLQKMIGALELFL